MTMADVISVLSRAPYKTKWSDMPTDVREFVDVSRLLAFYRATDICAAQVLHHIRQLRRDATFGKADDNDLDLDRGA